jgi:predicted SnoaL-like aldol condensation-catalyzing enzyme
MQQQTLNTKGKENPTYLDSQMVTRTQINLGQKGVVAYFVKAMKHYKDKEMLVVPFNMDNHCVTLLISTTDDQV